MTETQPVKIDAEWLTAPATKAVFDMLQNAGFQALAVGGCVRNALLGVAINDIDIATDAHPQNVTELAQKAGLNAVPTGIAHGTVTVISRGTPFEVTTFRQDVKTDGRRAEVLFADNIHADAIRRDFTMNALYLQDDGTVLDPLGGLSDLLARRVRFIKDPGQRIREDYLRILRFFRFHAGYGDNANGLDPAALAAIAAHLDGLDLLSPERVGSEITKLLSADDPAPAVAAMQRTGVLVRVLPGADDRMLAPLVHHEHSIGLAPDPMRRMAALGSWEIAQDLRLSKAQMGRLKTLSQNMTEETWPGAWGYLHGETVALDLLALRHAAIGQPIPAGATAEIKTGTQQIFPITAADLMPDITGPALGKALKTLQSRWIESRFTLSRDALLKL